LPEELAQFAAHVLPRPLNLNVDRIQHAPMPAKPPRPIRQFDLIAFDWDGTLFDSTAIITRCIQWRWWMWADACPVRRTLLTSSAWD
jgi:hypothetical protein